MPSTPLSMKRQAQMPPTAAGSFQGHYTHQIPPPPAARSRRPPPRSNLNPYDAAHNNARAARPVARTAIPVPAPPQHVLSPATLDEGDEEGDEDGEEEDNDTQEMDDEDEVGEGEGDDEDGDGGDEDEEEDVADVVDITEEIDDGTADGEGAAEEVPMDVDPPFDATGLKEIGNLASWTVSTYKPGCGVEALRDEDTDLFWQSDGPQPHHLNIHFSRLVCILSIRIYLDFENDESYTPTRITLLAGTGYHDLLPFSSLEFTQPKGWINVPLEGVGGGPDGNTLRAFLVQVKVVENHQNGKDTHVRGLKIYARDEKAGGGMGGMEDLVRGQIGGKLEKSSSLAIRETMLTEPDWMGEPELR